MMPARRFPPPWFVEEQSACYDSLLFEPPAHLKRNAARLAGRAPNMMLYLELPEGLQGSKIPLKRFKANIL
jgi:hypothetical protein